MWWGVLSEFIETKNNYSACNAKSEDCRKFIFEIYHRLYIRRALVKEEKKIIAMLINCPIKHVPIKTTYNQLLLLKMYMCETFKKFLSLSLFLTSLASVD